MADAETLSPSGRFRTFAELARGPMTSVFKAFDGTEDEVVLLKVLRPAAAADPERRARFLAEARLAAHVQHPNVVRVRHVDEQSGHLVQDWVEGGDLQSLLKKDGALPVSLAVYVAHQAALGLAAIHAAGILHRDIKPANVMIGADGGVRLTDFGLASVATDTAANGSEELRGTLATMAPEIVLGGTVTELSDVFSLGAVLFHMLTGTDPFDRGAPSETLDAILHTDPAVLLLRDPRIPGAVSHVLSAMLRRNPSERPASALFVAEALASACPGSGIPLPTVLEAFIAAPSSHSEPPPVRPHNSATNVSGDGPADAPTVVAPGPIRASRSLRTGWVVALVVIAVVALGALALRGLGSASRDDSSNTVSASPKENPVPQSRIFAPDDSASLDLTVDTDTPEGAALLADAQPSFGTVTSGGTTPSPSRREPPGRSDGAEMPSERPALVRENTAAPATRPPGTLSVLVDPWATVRINGRTVGTTPLAPQTLQPGSYALTLENPGFPSYSTTVEVRSGEAHVSSKSLWETVARVTLDVAPWAEVFVDGETWDTIPPQTRPLILRPGNHLLRFVHPTLGTRETSIGVAAGERRTVRVRMSEKEQ